MTPDHSALIERLELKAEVIKSRGRNNSNFDIAQSADLLAEAAACIRELVEQKPFAYFQYNEPWGVWEEVIEEAANRDGVVAAYKRASPA